MTVLADRAGRIWCLALMAVAAFASAGAARILRGDDATTQAAGEAAPVTLKVGVIPIADVAPLYLGTAKGSSSRSG